MNYREDVIYNKVKEELPNISTDLLVKIKRLVDLEFDRRKPKDIKK